MDKHPQKKQKHEPKTKTQHAQPQRTTATATATTATATTTQQLSNNNPAAQKLSKTATQATSNGTMSRGVFLQVQIQAACNMATCHRTRTEALVAGVVFDHPRDQAGQ